MRLTEFDLTCYCNAMDKKTDWKFSISPVKTSYGDWSLEMLNNQNQEITHLRGGLTLREAYEFLRAFYRWLELANYIN